MIIPRINNEYKNNDNNILQFEYYLFNENNNNNKLIMNIILTLNIIICQDTVKYYKYNYYRFFIFSICNYYVYLVRING